MCLIIESFSLQSFTHLDGTWLDGAFIHPMHYEIIQSRRIDDEKQVEGIPPSIKHIGSKQQPWDP
jgi:hypothetical protein